MMREQKAQLETVGFFVNFDVDQNIKFHQLSFLSIKVFTKGV